MAPEYALHGLFSVKADVYSFGVLVLEIITGRKNMGSQNRECSEDLLSLVSTYSAYSTFFWIRGIDKGERESIIPV